MDLQKFISQSLTEIIRGIETAKKDLITGPGGADICPRYKRPITETGRISGESSWGRTIFLIDYDVAVEAGTESGGGGSIKVLGGVLDIGGHGDAKNAERIVSRLKSSIPIVYPETKE